MDMRKFYPVEEKEDTTFADFLKLLFCEFNSFSFPSQKEFNKRISLFILNYFL